MKAIDADPGLHRFRKTNLFYTKDPYFLFQDPTILGFKIFFDFTGDGLLSLDPNRPNTALNYLKTIGQAERAYLLEKFINHFYKINNSTPWFFQEIEGLQDAWKRGFNEKEFSPLLPEDRKISIGCLESIDLRITALMDLYRKACFDWDYRREIVPWNLRLFNISIYVYELRNINVTGLPSATDFIDLDVNLTQQQQNEDLLGKGPYSRSTKKFSDILTSTLGNLGAITDEAVKTGIVSTFKGKDKYNLIESSNTIDNTISRILFNFEMCEFLPDESGEMLSKVSNKGDSDSLAAQKIAFSYRNLYEDNLSTLYSGSVGLKDKLTYVLTEELDKAALDEKPTDINNPRNYGVMGLDSTQFPMNVINPLAQYGSQYVQNLAKGQINKLMLGNIYGLQPANLISSAGNILNGNPSEVIGGISDVINQGVNTAKSFGAGNGSKDVDYIGNVFGKR